mmetsp:Transcript_5442/g.8034  ORF Transcript_5442/g.8034 Transcript_5442/m.8034 type:complete len:95 (+) Transcript_5442:122-406(+)
MGARDPQKLGVVLLGSLVAFAAYYMFWIIIIPFVDNKRFFLTEFFPPVEAALSLSTFLILMNFMLSFTMAGILFLKHSRDLKEEERNKILKTKS